MSKSKKRKKLIGEKTHSNSPSGESSDEMSVGSQSTLFQDTEDIKSNDFYAPYRVNDYLRRYPEDITGNEYIVFVESTEETPIGTRDMMYLNNCFTRFIKGINNSIDIAIISETWLRPHHKFNIKGYDIIRNDSGNAHNGVAIIILKSLCYTLINTAFDDSIQNVAISVQIYDENITIVSCYSPGNTMTRFYKDKFDNLIESLQQPLFIAGDFNAYHTAWGCDTTNSRGKDILDSIDEHNLIILNNGQFTTVGTHLWKQNALDLTIVSSSLALRCDWCVFTEDSLGSYHLPTITNISFEKPIINSEKTKIDAHPNLKLIDWELFEKSVNTLLNSYEINKNDPLESYNIFCSVIKNTIKDCSVVKSKKQNCNRCDSSKKNFVPWWNANCSKALEECKKAYIIFKRDPSLQNYIYFKKLQAKKKLILRQEQLNSWKSFCNSINRVTPMSKIWDMMKRFNRTYTRSNKFNCDNWIDNFLNKYTPAHADNIVVFDHSHSTDDNSYLTRPFTVDELKSALSSRKDTAVGMDRLSYKMFKLLNDHNLNKFLNILNLLWHHSLIPRNLSKLRKLRSFIMPKHYHLTYQQNF
ncbi:unnamed protein product [Euphydryas editha]|uniref:Endonuclease/exonuclease/phosphatase domain-containing protein n=1 Tax=Euphydryas editha TaxID=104508 RepID=A0AAU9UC65_EUPED|nr:unnamed protein product [Euphydryas editha]